MITINLANKSSYDFFSNTESRFYILTDPESLRGEGVEGGGGGGGCGFSEKVWVALSSVVERLPMALY